MIAISMPCEAAAAEAAGPVTHRAHRAREAELAERHRSRRQRDPAVGARDGQGHGEVGGRIERAGAARDAHEDVRVAQAQAGVP